MSPFERAWRGGRNDWRLHALSIFSVSVAFVCMAAALLVVVNVDALRVAWAKAGRASVYVKPGASDGAVREIEVALKQAPGVSAVRFVSSREARDELTGKMEDALLSELPDEAFPASLEVSLRDDAEESRLQTLAAQLQALPAVDSVETYQSWTERLESLLAGGVAAAGLLAAVVLGAVVSVVASTIRLTLQRRCIEVEVLKLVGATDEYVRRPFVIEGAVQGAVGAALAVLLLGLVYVVVTSRLDTELLLLVGASPTFLPWYLIVSMVALGGALGAGAAFASLRRLLIV